MRLGLRSPHYSIPESLTGCPSGLATMHDGLAAWVWLNCRLFVLALWIIWKLLCMACFKTMQESKVSQLFLVLKKAQWPLSRQMVEVWFVILRWWPSCNSPPLSQILQQTCLFIGKLRGRRLCSRWEIFFVDRAPPLRFAERTTI